MMSTYYQQQRRLPTNEDRVFKQRRYEAARSSKLEEIREYEKLMTRAAFDESCDARLSQRHAQLQAMQTTTLSLQSLASRRFKLKTLLEAEENQLHAEIATATMNLSQRRTWLQARHVSSSAPLALHHPESFRKGFLHNTKAAVSYLTHDRGGTSSNSIEPSQEISNHV